MKQALLLFGLVALTACQSADQSQDIATVQDDGDIKVTGELRSSNSYFFGPPAIPDTWNFTIAFMAPDGVAIPAGRPILRFDTEELMTKLRDKNNALNEKQKELDRTRILAREQLAELSLRTEEAKADLDKARMKADIPESLLASREFRENQLLLKHAELEFALRTEELARERVVQATEVNILEREVGVLEAEVAQFQGSIDSMTIKAPVDGVVIHVRDRRNNKLSVGDNTWMGRRVIEFPDLSQLEAHIEVPERESARIEVGQKVRFTMDAAPDREFFGEIVNLASVIHTRSINQPDKVFDATVRLDNPDIELMRPGMGINAAILAGEATEVAGL